MTERTLNCAECWTSLNVVGPDSQVQTAVTRCGWRYRGGEVTCRACLRVQAEGEYVRIPG